VDKGRIIYIDDDEEDIIYFQSFADGYFQVETREINNGSILEELVDEILSSPPDAVISDFLLNEKAKVGFNGQALIESLQSRNKHIPCFLLTSHAPDALSATHDARLVQAKSVVIGGDRDLQFLFREQIAKLIADHKKKLDQSEVELDLLLSIPNEALTISQRDRIIELDTYVEEHGHSAHVLPPELKSERSLELLTKLVAQVDKLLKNEGLE
jgi:hypothetical protein